MLSWNGEAAILEIFNATAEGLLRAAAYFQAGYRELLAVPYPPASKPGQFPHFRSGHGVLSVDFDPQTIAEVARTQTIRLGYNRAVPPGQHWSYSRGRGTTPPSYYMVALEIGHRRDGTPWDRRGLAAAMNQLARGMVASALTQKAATP